MAKEQKAKEGKYMVRFALAVTNTETDHQDCAYHSFFYSNKRLSASDYDKMKKSIERLAVQPLKKKRVSKSNP